MFLKNKFKKWFLKPKIAEMLLEHSELYNGAIC